MRTFEIHEARDGRRFDQEADCRAYEAIMDRVDAIMAALPPMPEGDGCRFANGGGYLQHDASNLKATKAALVQIAGEVSPYAAEKCGDVDAHISWWLRMLDGSCPYLERAMGRLYCVDNHFREWGQPYYAINPTEGKQVEYGSEDAAR